MSTALASFRSRFINVTNTEEFFKYYDIDSFLDSKFKSKNLFSIFHLNIASLSKHKSDLETLLTMLNFKF